MTAHDVDSAPLLRVENLTSEYLTTRGTVEALRGAGLEIGHGETVALVGESGSGKSTLSHALIGLLPENARITGGKILFGDTDVADWSDRQFRTLRGNRIGLIPQDPTVSLNPVRTIGHQVIEAIRAHRKMPKASAQAEAAELLDRAGIDRPQTRLQQYPHQLSGGMRQRVLIAIAIAGRPDLLIADEPTSALDATVQKKILDHLQELTAELGTSVLLVTHDLGVAADRADRIVVMNGGRIVEAGTSDEVLTNPTDAYTRRLVAAAPGLSEPSRAPAPLPADTEVLLSAKDLRREFTLPARRGEPKQTIHAVDGVSFDLLRGETLALVGESGSGKSTTAKLVLGLEKPDAGSITFAGEDVTSLRGEAWRQLRRRAQLIYQNPYASLDPRFSIEQIITEPLDAFKVGSKEQRRKTAAKLLDQVALPEGTLQRRPAELSGGQRQRVAIARALTLSPDLVVCDEPVSALDVSVQAQVLDLLADLQAEQGLTYLFITHDLAVVRHLAHRVAVMRSGQIIETGPTQEIFESAEHPYTRELLESISGARAEDDLAGALQ
ncbi:ABC transporter ATP-binding protein [Nesterenkonia sp. MY13]|uniref:ABC transporter ATP-binding protein n=1 Tax=Nesterenkonia sedimenti TaxID=1463632 RepID=A0A7X8TL28_9MICC|nr:ABC transporter ATP-binding protein [Nesterenkonia sedimenti]NLS10775.1 ABC transporter ATP-binding protein [Nesterenkonia sedimenti]